MASLGGTMVVATSSSSSSCTPQAFCPELEPLVDLARPLFDFFSQHLEILGCDKLVPKPSTDFPLTCKLLSFALLFIFLSIGSRSNTILVKLLPLKVLFYNDYLPG